MTASRLDQLYRSILHSRFFIKGWGQPDSLKRMFELRQWIRNRENSRQIVSPDHPIHIDKEATTSDCKILEGHFLSPMVEFAPGMVPPEAEVAKFQMILPLKWKSQLRPMCVHLAGTGDHGYWKRRTLVARPLVKQSGIASILLENPYYGARKPKEQWGSALQNVTDLFVMGGCLILESIALFNWCERQGFGPIGITGISMGGHMASLAAGNYHKPIPLIPCMSWSTASSVFTRGVLSGSIDWQLLQSQYKQRHLEEQDFRHMLHSPESTNPAFCLGREFARGYPYGRQFVEKFQRMEVAKQHEMDILVLRAILEYQALSKRRRAEPGRRAARHFINDRAATERKFAHLQRAAGGADELDVAACRQAALYFEAADRRREHVREHTEKDSAAYQMFRFIHNQADDEDAASWWRGDGDDDSGASWWRRRRDEHEDAHDFMRGVMDEFTHVANYSVPVDTSLIIVVAAESDAYIPREGVFALTDVWPGCEVRYVQAGHIATFLFKQHVFRRAIADAFNRAAVKYFGASLDGAPSPSRHPQNKRAFEQVALDHVPVQANPASSPHEEGRGSERAKDAQY
ncbi:PREDICTED: uncharacterized protein C4orf29 homolog [Priapulus caudatus]|uniref:Uncharacterized protein C4orf29 homolog n=1 Tax=Priapulus caudatus TaxID=37621 RepID=A0ABM1ENZ3_PRICU|nr:PREDICTED: uncharacterized protein C4orf29 homolog [Priapulus caudatus]